MKDRAADSNSTTKPLFDRSHDFLRRPPSPPLSGPQPRVDFEQTGRTPVLLQIQLSRTRAKSSKDEKTILVFSKLVNFSFNALAMQSPGAPCLKSTSHYNGGDSTIWTSSFPFAAFLFDSESSFSLATSLGVGLFLRIATTFASRASSLR